MAYKFIEEIKAQIVKNCPGAERATRDAIELWETDEKPRSPYESGVFSMCNQIQEDIDKPD